MGSSPRKCGGAISAAKTGTTDALHPIPNPSSTRVSANCHVFCVADPKMAARITDTAETMMAPRRPKRSSLMRTSENKQRLLMRQCRRCRLHRSTHLHSCSQVRSRIHGCECPDALRRGCTGGDSVRSVWALSSCITVEFERCRPAQVRTIRRCLSPSLDSGSNEKHQIRRLERPRLLPKRHAFLIRDRFDLFCGQFLLLVNRHSLSLVVLFVFIIWQHIATGMLRPENSCCLGDVSDCSPAQVVLRPLTLTKTASEPHMSYSHARRLATFLAWSSSHLAKGLSSLLPSVRKLLLVGRA
jgi:hypothetical protein